MHTIISYSRCHTDLSRLQLNAGLVLVNVMWHTYISFVIYLFIVKKVGDRSSLFLLDENLCHNYHLLCVRFVQHSLAQLKRTVSPRAVLIGACLICKCL